MKATLDQVENEVSEYFHRVIDGETIVVYQGERPIAEIRPMTETETLRPVGLAAGKFVVPHDFDDPLPDEILNPFEGR
jgi:antitoxin (DNA-binding transcriptional repressor) of toxin-antitoxin stability system